jgi:hypothetical protein
MTIPETGRQKIKHFLTHLGTFAIHKKPTLKAKNTKELKFCQFSTNFHLKNLGGQIKISKFDKIWQLNY